MQIKIEIEVRPDELRRFIGLPDVAGLQDDVVRFLREKLHQAGDSFDAGAFVKSNLRLLSKSPLLGKLLTPVKDAVGYGAEDEQKAAPAASAAASAVEEMGKRKAASVRAARKSAPRAPRKSARRKAKRMATPEV
jgi:hypothetical protein